MVEYGRKEISIFTSYVGSDIYVSSFSLLWSATKPGTEPVVLKERVTKAQSVSRVITSMAKPPWSGEKYSSPAPQPVLMVALFGSYFIIEKKSSNIRLLPPSVKSMYCVAHGGVTMYHVGNNPATPMTATLASNSPSSGESLLTHTSTSMHWRPRLCCLLSEWLFLWCLCGLQNSAIYFLLGLETVFSGSSSLFSMPLPVMMSFPQEYWDPIDCRSRQYGLPGQQKSPHMMNAYIIEELADGYLGSYSSTPAPSRSGFFFRREKACGGILWSSCQRNGCLLSSSNERGQYDVPYWSGIVTPSEQAKEWWFHWLFT